jgi:hypothetical protein
VGCGRFPFHWPSISGTAVLGTESKVPGGSLTT